MINTDQAEGRMTQLKGKIKETWGKLTESDLMLYKGQREQFLGKLKEHYGMAKEEAEKKLKTMEDAYTPNDDAQHAGKPYADMSQKSAITGVTK